MAYKGKYTPQHPEKYKGDPTKIIYRSNWERNCMKTFDCNPNILFWSSEELSLPYLSPLDGKIHQYFPDFLVKVRSSDGSEKKYLIEVKPLSQCSLPILPKSKRKTRRYKTALATFAVNQMKWKAARSWCEKTGYEFKIMTETDCT